MYIANTCYNRINERPCIPFYSAFQIAMCGHYRHVATAEKELSHQQPHVTTVDPLTKQHLSKPSIIQTNTSHVKLNKTSSTDFVKNLIKIYKKNIHGHLNMCYSLILYEVLVLIMLLLLLLLQ